MRMSEMFVKCNELAYQSAGHDVNYAFIEDRRHLQIYFQGSSSTTDWIRNFMFRKKPYKDMKQPYYVHRGFCDAWKEVEDIIIAKVTEKAKDGTFKWQNIEVIGYSHGAALAAFCHECVWFNRQDLGALHLHGYAFEAPRIMAQWHVSKELKARWTNFTVIRNNSDIVTHCPPVIFGYRHVGHMLHIGKCKKYGPVRSHYPDKVKESLEEYEAK
jgi:hypothetical protein